MRQLALAMFGVARAGQESALGAMALAQFECNLPASACFDARAARDAGLIDSPVSAQRRFKHHTQAVAVAAFRERRIDGALAFGKALTIVPWTAVADGCVLEGRQQGARHSGRVAQPSESA